MPTSGATISCCFVFTLAVLSSSRPLPAADTAPAQVTISEMHLCCKGCTSAVEKAAASVEGTTCVPSEDDHNTVLTAPDQEAL